MSKNTVWDGAALTEEEAERLAAKHKAMMGPFPVESDEERWHRLVKERRARERQERRLRQDERHKLIQGMI